MTLPNYWVIFLASSLVGSMTHAQPHMTGRDPKTRQLAITAVSGAPELEVRVAPGHLTQVKFGWKLAPEGVKVEGERERLKKLDVSQTHLTLEPAAELEPGSRLRVTVRFPDGFLPEQVVLVLVTKPAEVDTEVMVSRLPSTMGEILAELNATRARLAAAHQQLQAQRLSCSANSMTERMFSELGQGEDASPHGFFQDPTLQSGLEYIRATVHRSSEFFILGIRIRIAAAALHLAPWTPDVVKLTHQPTGRRVKVLSLEMRPPRFTVGGEVVVVMELEPLPFPRGDFQLSCGDEEGGPLIKWKMVML